MANSGSFPNKETLEKSKSAQNVKKPGANSATASAGAFCNLATNISAPIVEAINGTIAALNSVQGAIDSILYAPARGILELQRKIASGEILNDITKQITYSIGQIIKNAAKSLANAVVTSAVGRLADKVTTYISTQVGRITRTTDALRNSIVKGSQFVRDKVLQAEASIAYGVYRMAALPGDAILAAGNATGSSLLRGLGSDVVKLAASTTRAFEQSLIGVTKGVFAPLAGSSGVFSSRLPNIEVSGVKTLAPITRAQEASITRNLWTVNTTPYINTAASVNRVPLAPFKGPPYRLPGT